jgi:hypothetical protein
MAKNLPTKEQINQRYNRNSKANFLRSDPEVSAWLIEIFKAKESGELSVRWTDVAEMITEFSIIEIGGESVGKAYQRWKTTGKL